VVFSFICLLTLAAGAVGVVSPIIFPKQANASTEAAQPLAASPTSPTAQIPSTGTTGLPGGEGMVEIPSGDYVLGTTPADEFHSASQSIALGDFWIDAYQTSNAQYGQFLEQTGGQPPEIWPASENNPVRGVTWDQANAYCTGMNKRLPTEAEWEAAGRGSGQNPQLYPWGEDPIAGGKALDLPDQDTYEVGTQPFNKSPFGVYDLVGNVWEWVGEPYGSVQTGFKVLRGGRFGLPQDLAYRLVIAPDDERYIKYAGFRCAADQVE
jgi:formylglycine-generating enzyme required for sulfatase activity